MPNIKEIIKDELLPLGFIIKLNEVGQGRFSEVTTTTTTIQEVLVWVGDSPYCDYNVQNLTPIWEEEETTIVYTTQQIGNLIWVGEEETAECITTVQGFVYIPPQGVHSDVFSDVFS